MILDKERKDFTESCPRQFYFEDYFDAFVRTLSVEQIS